MTNVYNRSSKRAKPMKSKSPQQFGWGRGKKKKKKKTKWKTNKQNPSAVQVYRLLGLKGGKEVSAGMNEGLWEGWAKEGSRDEARRLEVTGWWDARPIQPFEVVYPRRRREIARDSVTSSGRQPSWSVIVGSAPDFSSRSTISTNSHAEA